MDSYEALAASYDELTEDVEYEKRADFVEKLFLRAKRPVRSLLDLACGTGTGAVVTVLTLLGKVSGKGVRVDMTGGTLFIDVVRREDGGVSDLFLTGPTNVVCKGCITDENL